MRTDMGVPSPIRFHAPPRSVKFRSIGAMLHVWKVRIYIFALGLIPLFLWWVTLEIPIVYFFGKEVSARVENVRPAGDGQFNVTYSVDLGVGSAMSTPFESTLAACRQRSEHSSP